MTLQEICILLGKSENTIIYNFKRTQDNLKKKGIILTKQGRGNNANYSIIFPSYTIYMHRNKINGKVYIGQTKQKLSARWRDGEGYKTQPYFYKAIQKYGWNNFEHIVLEENLTLEQANNKEEYWIAYYKSNIKEFGYNILAGGNNHIWTKEMKQKQSECLSGEKGPFFGQKHTDEYKNNMRKQMKEKWNDKNYRQQTCKNMKEKHANFKGGNNPQAKQVRRKDTGEIFACCGEAAISIQKNWVQGGKTIARCCRGERKTAYGYEWEYIEKEK